MPNRSQEENEALILCALRDAGENGMSLDEVRIALFGPNEQSNSLTKKLLEKVKAKGCIRIRMGRQGPCYTIIPGR
jgi:lysylphosphatidylglycerol synthetase-like protein (DUF2156 family)